MASALRALTEWLCRYVPHKDAERYRKKGWTLIPLLGKHGDFSVLAVRKVRMSKPKYTHQGLIAGADARTRDDWRGRVLLRKGKRHWLTDKGLRFDLDTGWGTGDWPRFRLVIETVRERA